jgi:integrase
MAVGRTRQTNKHLPRRVYFKHGAYYWEDPRTRKWVPLGRTLGDMYRALGRLLEVPEHARTMADLIHRYRAEVVPQKAPRTQADHLRYLALIEAYCGTMTPADILPVHLYEFRDAIAAKGKLTKANRALEVFKHLCAMGRQWGAMPHNPGAGIKRLEIEQRSRYVTDAELAVVRGVAAPMIRCAIDLAVLTGQRRGDLLTLTRDQLLDDGILFRQAKTGKAVLVEWSDELRAVVAEAKAIPPQVRRTVLCTRAGTPFTADGFSTVWDRTIQKARKAGLSDPFRFHDLRAKSASDDTLQAAVERLGHSSPAVTNRHYRRAPAKVKPLR